LLWVGALTALPGWPMPGAPWSPLAPGFPGMPITSEKCPCSVGQDSQASPSRGGTGEGRLGWGDTLGSPPEPFQCRVLTFSPLGPAGPLMPGSPDSPGRPSVPAVPLAKREQWLAQGREHCPAPRTGGSTAPSASPPRTLSPSALSGQHHQVCPVGMEELMKPEHPWDPKKYPTDMGSTHCSARGTIPALWSRCSGHSHRCCCPFQCLWS